MDNKRLLFIFLGVILNCNVYQGREVNKAQQYNPNLDFLSHESGVLQPDPKSGLPSQPGVQSNVQNNQRTTSSGKRDYVAPQRPTSKPHSTPSASATSQQTKDPLSDSNFPPLGPYQNPYSSGKRDYVAPQRPTSKPHSTPSASSTSQQIKDPLSDTNFPSLGPNKNIPSSGKRDYVAPHRPTSKPYSTPSASSTSQQTKDPFSNSNFPSLGPYQNSPSSGKRDYVAPNWPKLPSPQTSSHTPTSPSVPQPTSKPTATANNNGHRDYVNPNWPALPTPPSFNKNSPLSPTSPTLKPPSFSSVVAGGGGGQSMSASSSPAPLPSKKDKPTVLPSSLVNKNQYPTNSNSPTDLELQNLSEELLRKDTNNAFTLITINYQGKTTSQSKDDKAPLPFLVIPDKVWNMPTIQKFVPLLDNYEWDTLVNEYVTPQERKEENEFIDAIMSTAVIRHLMSFLREKGYVTLDPKQQRDFLKQLWFTLYSRGKGKIGSSGFEHIFVSELKNGQVSGLHNWIYFAKEEALNRVNYLGYMKLAEFNNKGAVIKFHFTQQGYDKPVDSMFVGTSPELEMALYTVCFVTRADKDCQLKLGGKDVTILSHTFRYRSRNLIGSAFPQI